MPDKIPTVNRQLVQGRAFGHCERCSTATLCGDLHHRRVRGIGGSRRPDRHDPSGLLYLCRPCHDWVHRHPNQSRETGFIIPRSSTVQFCEIPFADLAGRVRYLDDDGQYLNDPLEVGTDG